LLNRGTLVSRVGSIDSLAPARSPYRASSISRGSRRLHSRPRLSIRRGLLSSTVMLSAAKHL